MYRRALVLPLFCLCGALFAAPASAQNACRFSLRWAEGFGAELCADRGIAQAVEERLGHRVFAAPGAAQRSIEARVERADRPVAWRAIIALRDGQGGLLGSRELESEALDGSDLRDSMTLRATFLPFSS
jgi:hypothetical protein